MTLRTIAHTLDPVDRKITLKKTLAAHFSEPGLRSLKEVDLRHQSDMKRLQRFFVFNTFLMDIPGAGRKPAVERRDAEIGRYISPLYDLVCLNEVWHREERLDLLDQWQGPKFVTHKSGRRAAINALGILGSAGLVGISRELEPIETKFHEYKAEAGSDARADKGCLLTVYSTGFRDHPNASSLLVYNTHLNAGGDRNNARFRQVLELFAFIWRTKDKPGGDTRRPNRSGLNGCILAGDFNINRWKTDAVDLAHVLRREIPELPNHLENAVFSRFDGQTFTPERVSHKTGYELLRDLAFASGFRDLWAHRNESKGYTSDLMDDDIAAVISRQDPFDRRYCDDNIDEDEVRALSKKPSTLDYIFVSATTANMDFTMDFTRPRRAFTPRPHGARDRDKFAWLSDHIGLATDIILAPKAAG